MEQLTTPIFWPGEFHGLYSPWAHRESDMTEQLSLSLSWQIWLAAAAKSLQLCLTVWSHRWQPTRLPRPWDSPGKNTGVGCHFLLQCVKVKSESEVAQSCPTLSNPLDRSLPASLLHSWDCPGKRTGVGCRCLLQRLRFQQLNLSSLEQCSSTALQC